MIEEILKVLETRRRQGDDWISLRERKEGSEAQQRPAMKADRDSSSECDIPEVLAHF
jgi:hypothetical protein